jgi:hypothetical protein
MRDSLRESKIFPLRKLIADLTQEELSDIISSFSCERDRDVESFLKEKAIVQEKKWSASRIRELPPRRDRGSF